MQRDVWCFFKFSGGHQSVLWGHWYPNFGFLVTSPLGSKTRVGSLIHAWQRCVCSLRFISGATPAGILATELFHTCTCIQALVGLGSRIKHAAASQRVTRQTLYRATLARLRYMVCYLGTPAIQYSAFNKHMHIHGLFTPLMRGLYSGKSTSEITLVSVVIS